MVVFQMVVRQHGGISSVKEYTQYHTPFHVYVPPVALPRVIHPPPPSKTYTGRSRSPPPPLLGARGLGPAFWGDRPLGVEEFSAIFRFRISGPVCGADAPGGGERSPARRRPCGGQRYPEPSFAVEDGLLARGGGGIDHFDAVLRSDPVGHGLQTDRHPRRPDSGGGQKLPGDWGACLWWRQAPARAMAMRLLTDRGGRCSLSIQLFYFTVTLYY